MAAPSPAAGGPAPETGAGLSLVVPVYNEQASVATLLRQVRAALPDAELIVVDDGSHDGTADRLAQLAADPTLRLRLLRHARNRGKGAALRTGFAAVTGPFAVVQDADLEYDPTELPALLRVLRAGAADAVYGSRFLDARHRALSRSHVWINRTITALSNWVTGLALTDMETCYKMLRTDLLRSLRLQEDRFGIEPEITIALAAAGARVVEVPIGYRARTWAQGKKIGPRDAVRTLWVLGWWGWRRLPGRMLAITTALVVIAALVAWGLTHGLQH